MSTKIGAETGASIVTKGIWLPDKSKATAQEPPLYLHIAASSQEQLDKAVGKVSHPGLVMLLKCMACGLILRPRPSPLLIRSTN
jgi:hypothetical protein